MDCSLSPELTFDFTAEDLEDLGEIGRGAYGTVQKMLHIKSQTLIAVKVLSPAKSHLKKIKSANIFIVSWICALKLFSKIFIVENSLHRGWEGAEEVDDGFGSGHEIKQLSVYCHVLWGDFQRRWLLDL